MEITKVKIRRLYRPVLKHGTNNEYLKAYCSIVFDDVFMIHSIKIIEDEFGNLYINMQQERLKDGSYKDIYHSVSKDFRKELKEKIITAYLESD